MASVLRSAVLLLMITALVTYPVHSHDQLSTLENEHSQIISILEEMSNNTTSLSNAVSGIAATQTRIADRLDKIEDCSNIEDKCRKSEPTVAMPTTVQIFPKYCSDISDIKKHGSGVYTIDPRDGQGSFDVYCNMDTDEGGWTVFQKRFDGSVDFFLGWDDYENGFGSLQGEHWLGLQKMHRLTSSGRWTLRIDLEDFDGNTGYAQYEDFQIGDAESFYRLSIGAFSGDIVDQLTYHNGQSFTTKDQNHDNASYNCATNYKGAWWYSGCHNTNLNGIYRGSSSSSMCWYKFPAGSGYKILKKAEMKIRRIQ